MPRMTARPRGSAVAVRAATNDDAPALAVLTRDVDVASVFARMSRSGGPAKVRAAVQSTVGATSEGAAGRIERALSAPDNHILLATFDDEPVGMLWCTIGPLGLLGSDRVVHIEQFHVCRSRRRRGVGRNLLQAVTQLAEAHGADAVTTWTGPQDREVNRYFARAGFAPLAVRRIAAVSSLRRSLAPPSELNVPFPRAAEALRRTRRRAI
jgi:GNAT superfamily N-acetyltransferase